jgi:signal transduction histidine kinase
MSGDPTPPYTLLMLVIDGSPHLFHRLHRYLQNAGHIVLNVTARQQAEAHLQTHPVDVIVTDDSAGALALLADTDALAFDITERPLHCVLTETDTAPNSSAVDIALPHLAPAFIFQQIATHLNYRHKLSQFQKHQNEVHLLKNAIVRNVSHELKTPLLQVKAAVGLLAEDGQETRITQMAVEATARLEAVVKNITLLAEITNASFGPVLVTESVDQATRNLRRSWEHKNEVHRLKRHLDSALPPIHADKQGLSIVLQELIDNALKFSKKQQTPVEVHAHRCENGVRIVVKDQGIGIAEDKLKNIFEAFYQVDSSSTRIYGGIGVGLSIVRLILEKHHVEITVESKLGQGSSFAFVIPEADL